MSPPVHRYAVVESTMDLIHRLAAEGAEQGTAVVAGEQVAGRGSRGRAWQSGPGGLWLSILLRPAAAAADLLSLRAGLAAVRAMRRLDPGLGPGLKWPNDLMLDDRKLGGILCEGRWSGDAPAWVAVGIGINVRNTVPEELAQSAVALCEFLPHVTPDAVLDPLLLALRALDGATTRLDGVELEELDRCDWLRGRRVERPVEGWADGIGADGTLRIRQADGASAEVRAGSVEVARSSGRA
jgi:BirA family transcriptional regulator, biotin operon repressor / biotin---[acetyl-CoA-carboxylase] ligase